MVLRTLKARPVAVSVTLVLVGLVVLLVGLGLFLDSVRGGGWLVVSSLPIIAVGCAIGTARLRRTLSIGGSPQMWQRPGM